MGDLQHFCLRWNNYQNNITSAFENLRDDEDFIDVTLACDGKSLKAHRVVLSACSPYFRELLKSTPCKHPVIVLQDVSFDDLQALVQFIYHGEVNVHQKNLTSFLKTAEVLKVSGLTQQPSSTDMFNDNLSHVSSRSSNMSDKRPSSDLHSNPTEDSPVSRNVAPYKNRRQIRSPTPISRSSYSADDSPLSLKRTKSTEESSPPLLNCSNVTSPIAERSSSSPVTVLSSQNQQQSKRGGSSSQRSSPLTNNYDENHNDEERPPVVVDPNKPEEEEDDERDEDEEEEPPMDFSRHSYTKYSQSIMSALQQSQQQQGQQLQGQPSPKDLSMNVTNAGVKEEPMDLVSCNNNDEDDRDSSNSDDRLSDESSVNRPSSGVGEREDPFPAHPGYLDSKLFAAAGASFNFSMAAALAADSFSAGFGHQNHASAASAMLEGFGSSSQGFLMPPPLTGAMNEPQDCPHCHRTFSCYYSLKRHYQDKHDHRNNTLYVCEFCNRRYRTKNSLTTHKSLQHRASSGLLKRLLKSAAASSNFVPTTTQSPIPITPTEFQSTALLFQSFMYNNR